MLAGLRVVLALLLAGQVSAHGPRNGWIKPPTPAGVTAADLEYFVDGSSYTGYVAFPDQGGAQGVTPGTLLAHQWYGLGDMEKYRCEEMAATMGWPCFALDVYGTGVRPTNDAEAEGNMTVLTSDPAELHARLAGSLAAFTDCELLPAPLNASAVSANGYCFGGQMVLELARQGAAVAAVTSFHGELDSLTASPDERIAAAVSVHHAELDFQGDGALRAFEDEMKAQNVTHWFTKYYGHMEHGWTDPSLDVYALYEAETAHQDMFGTYRLLFTQA